MGWTLLGGMLLSSLTGNLDLHRSGIEYQWFHPSARESFMLPYKPKEGIGFDLDMDLAKGVFWDNRIQAITDSGQYRTVEWKFALGVQIIPTLSIQYRHDSRHLLDDRPRDFYQVEDSLGAYWMIHLGETRRALFGAK